MESNLTLSFGQYLTANSQKTRSKIDFVWEHVYEERYINGRKTLVCLYCKKVVKGGHIHKIKQHLVGMKWGIGPFKSVPLNVRFEWKILYRSLWILRK